MARVFWVWGAVLFDFYNMSQANNVDIFGLPKQYSANILPSCINITVPKASIHYKYARHELKTAKIYFIKAVFSIQEITITMSQANIGHVKKWYKITFVGIFFANTSTKLK